MQNNPLLSIRLMVFNNEPFIKETIEGILMQKTNFNYEIVVGDDFSTDNTLNIIKEYASKHSDKFNILERPLNGKYFNDRKRLGRIHNFVDIVNHCSGKYVAILDGDDYWTDPNKLQLQVDFLESNTEFSIAFHQAREFWPEGKEQYTNIDQPEITDCAYLIKKGWHMRSASIVFRKSALPPLWPSWVYDIESMDYTVQFLLTKHGQKIKYFDQCMCDYRIHSNNVSSKLNNNYIVVLNRNKKLLKYFKKETNDDQLLNILSNRLNKIETNLFYQLRAKNNKTISNYIQIISLAKSLGKLNPFKFYSKRMAN